MKNRFPSSTARTEPAIVDNVVRINLVLVEHYEFTICAATCLAISQNRMVVALHACILALAGVRVDFCIVQQFPQSGTAQQHSEEASRRILMTVLIGLRATFS